MCGTCTFITTRKSSRHCFSETSGLPLLQWDALTCRDYGNQWHPQCVPYVSSSGHFWTNLALVPHGPATNSSRTGTGAVLADSCFKATKYFSVLLLFNSSFLSAFSYLSPITSEQSSGELFKTLCDIPHFSASLNWDSAHKVMKFTWCLEYDTVNFDTFWQESQCYCKTYSVQSVLYRPKLLANASRYHCCKSTKQHHVHRCSRSRQFLGGANDIFPDFRQILPKIRCATNVFSSNFL